MQRPLIGPVLATGLTAVVLTGCSFSIGGGTVPEKEVEKQAASALKSNGINVDGVDCTKGLKAKVDAKLDCDVSIQGEKVPVTITVTSVKDGKAQFSVRQKQ